MDHRRIQGWDGVGGRKRFKGRGHMSTYGWFMLMDTRNEHKIMKQASSN